MHVLPSWSCSRSDTGSWRRLVSFARDPDCIVVFDSFPGEAELTVPLVSDDEPRRSKDSFLCRRSEETLLVSVPPGEHATDYRDDVRLDDEDRRNDVWYVDEPARLVRRRGRGPFVTVFIPRPEAGISVTRALGAGGHDATSVVRTFPAGRETHGITAGRPVRFGELETDAELFLCREGPDRTDVRAVGASSFSLPASRPPRSVTIPEGGGTWRCEKSRITLTFPPSAGARSASITW